MQNFVDGASSDRFAAIKSFTANVIFDEDKSEIIVVLTIKPIRAIERITVNIIVT